MKCPRCGNEWDTGKHLCPHCGLSEPLSASSGTISRASSMLWSQQPLDGDSGVPLSPEAVVPSPSPVASSPASAVATPFPISIPARPQVPFTPPPMIDQASPAAPRLPSSLRAWKLVTAPLRQSSARVPEVPGAQGGRRGPAEVWTAQPASMDTLRPLFAGVFLRGGRYRLHALQSRQEWAAGVYEGVWIAQDAQRPGSLVMITELVIPGQNIRLVQSLLSASTIALTSIGRHTVIPTLWDAFGEHGRHFFVFEPVPGESLLMHIRRTRRALPERDVVACCFQIIDVLDLLTQQTPPMVVHGLIRPEHVVMSRDGASYRLTNFSVVLAGGETRFITGIDHARLSPYAAPELARGVVDVRSDLYSLLATAYHIVTGSRPIALNGSIPQAQRLNPTISPQFDAILAKGLRNSIGQRFQRPSELRQELLALQALTNASSRAPVELSVQQRHIPSPASSMNSQARMQALDNANDDRGARLSLPPMSDEERNDLRFILLWIGGIVLCLVVVMLLIYEFM